MANFANMRFVQVFIFTFLLLFGACKPTLQTDVNGFDWHLYLDTYGTMMNDIVKYGTKIKGFTEVLHTENGKPDTNFLAGTMVDWDGYLQPFLSLNMYDSKYQGVYTMSQMIDTNTKTVDIHYDAMYKNLPIQKMIVKLNSINSELQSVYAEKTMKGAFTKSEQTILYQSGSLLQIVDTKHSVTGVITRTAKQLNFIVNNEPTIEIKSALDQ
jgi:hypothetical protein